MLCKIVFIFELLDYTNIKAFFFRKHQTYISLFIGLISNLKNKTPKKYSSTFINCLSQFI